MRKAIKTLNNRERNLELIKLISENPDLPIIGLVDSDVVCEDSGRWLSSFGKAYVGEIAIYDDRYFNSRESFKECYCDNNSDELCKKFKYDPSICQYFVENGRYTPEQYKANKEAEEKMEKYLDEIADMFFTKGIIVNVDLPDDLIVEL